VATWNKLNAKVVEVTLNGGENVFARRGSMLAVGGNVTFTPSTTAGRSLGGFVGRVVAGEQVPLMVAEGSGRILYGHAGLQVRLVELTGETLSVEADKLLAYDASLQAGTQFLGSGGGGLRAVVQGQMTGQGLFTTLLSGSGTVVLLSHGPTFDLSVGGGEVAIDQQAYVGHHGNVTVKLESSMGWRDAVGRGSGEAFQLKLTGQGTAFVQASEQRY